MRENYCHMVKLSLIGMVSLHSSSHLWCSYCYCNILPVCGVVHKLEIRMSPTLFKWCSNNSQKASYKTNCYNRVKLHSHIALPRCLYLDLHGHRFLEFYYQQSIHLEEEVHEDMDCQHNQRGHQELELTLVWNHSWKVLYDKFKWLNEVKADILFGILPENWLQEKSIDSHDFIFSLLLVISPDKWLCDKYKPINLVGTVKL